MATLTPSTISRYRLPFALSITITLSMAILYTALDSLQLSELMFAILAFAPGVVSLLALQESGLSWATLNMRYSRLTGPGLAALAATTVLLLPILSSNSSFTGWQWLPALVYGPASGIAQELYFRAALLPGLERAFNQRRTAALLVHSAIFVGFHFRTFQALPSLPIALLVAVVLFLAGCGWGWQVQQDRTIVWAMLQHSLFLVLMSMFTWA